MDSRYRPRTRTRPARPAGPWKHGALAVIGVVGAIGAGKSQVAALLARRGGFVLDADAVGHALLTQAPVRDRVRDRFGDAILGAEAAAGEAPAIDRRLLGRVVFGDRAALRDLETILHPRMKGTFERAIARTARLGRHPALILDAAILFEAGWNTLCDRTLFVDAPRAARLARLAAQRGWSEDALDARERAQWPADSKRKLVDAVIENDASLEALDLSVGRFWDQLRLPSRRPPAPRPRGDAAAAAVLEGRGTPPDGTNHDVNASPDPRAS